jgi:hypothetical protein
MTYKHIKFADSPVMRSFERVAYEKGMFKNEPEMLKKEASAPDLSPTENLMENVLKLCSGLRMHGFDKQADELETNYVMYAQAAVEKGEDLIHDAHPKTKHIEGIDSIFENILDKHLKFILVVNKKPSGKLASSKDIINAVKIALADSIYELRNKEAKKIADKTQSLLVNLTKLIQESTWSKYDKSLWSKTVTELNTLVSSPTKFATKNNAELTLESLMHINSSYINKSVFTNKDEDAVLDMFQQPLDEVILNTKRIVSILSGLVDEEILARNPQKIEDAVPDANSPKVILKFKDLLNRVIPYYKDRVKFSDLANKQELLDWLDKKVVPLINGYIKSLEEATDKTNPKVLEYLEVKHNQVYQKLNAFESKWLK